MIVRSPFRRLLRVFHPEGIPRIGTLLYNAISGTSVFERQYAVVAGDIVTYRPQGAILDVGTGPARLLIKLHDAAPGLKLVGMDVSRSMVSRARKNIARAGLASVIEVHEGNADEIPFADESFDCVVSTGSLHHWKDPIAGLNEVRRVLKRGGYALVYDVASDTPQEVLSAAAKEFGRARVMLFWLHAFEEPFYRSDDFVSLARESAFGNGYTRRVALLCCLVMRKNDRG